MSTHNLYDKFIFYIAICIIITYIYYTYRYKPSVKGQSLYYKILCTIPKIMISIMLDVFFNKLINDYICDLPLLFFLGASYG